MPSSDLPDEILDELQEFIVTTSIVEDWFDDESQPRGPRQEAVSAASLLERLLEP